MGTKTSRFGSSKKESHDSSIFYKSKLYGRLEISDKIEVENKIGNTVNNIYCKDSKKISDLPDSSVHLMVTSPPYNVSKEYDKDLTLDGYLDFLRETFEETHRVLVNGGRACINIANVGRKPYIPYHKYVISIMQKIGFLMRGEIIWNKRAAAGSSTAWGSWKSASNPILRDIHEYILVFSKGKFKRNNNGKVNTITKDEFLEFTKSVWEFAPESAKKVGHPAPFPLELPYRCIQLYTYKKEIILDPFCGVGTSCIAAIKANRNYIGYDINQKYVISAKKRISDYLKKKNSGEKTLE